MSLRDRRERSASKLTEPIPARPFLIWFDSRRAALERGGQVDDPNMEALRLIGWADDAGVRRMFRWGQTSVIEKGRRRGRSDLVERDDVETALISAGLQLYDLADPQPADLVCTLAGARVECQLRADYLARARHAYRPYDSGQDDVDELGAAPATAWCPTCMRDVVPLDDGCCSWCDTQTGGGARPPEPVRRPRRRAYLRQDEPGFGPVCPRCGGAKSKQARQCGRCWAQLGAPRAGSGPRPDARIPSCIRLEDLEEARRLYATGLSLRQVAAILHPRTDYKTVASCAEGLYSLFKTRGWKLRPQRAVTAARNYRHGRKARTQTREEQNEYRRWLADQRGWNSVQGPGQELCKGVKTQPPRKGSPCEHHAMEGSEFCWNHDPARALEREAQLARMRRRLPSKPMLSAAPFAAWLLQVYDELGSWDAVAERTALSTTQAHRYARRPAEWIGVDRVQRSAAAAATTLEAIYGAVDELAA